MNSIALSLYQLPLDNLYFAETTAYNYGENTYGSSTYNGEYQHNPDNLINSGVAIGLTVTVGALIILAALVTKLWKRPLTKTEDLGDQ